MAPIFVFYNATDTNTSGSSLDYVIRYNRFLIIRFAGKNGPRTTYRGRDRW